MSTVTKPSASGPFDPDLRSALLAMVRKRVPESEVEDIVQQALAEAIESPHAPTDSESLRRWIFGVAKNKVVDYHRRAGRESFDLPDVEGTPAPHVEADLLRWAEKNLPEGAENKKTLDWMLREGEGEKLESIAASEKLPPPRVRQRVSRLRRHFKENWQREVAMLAALGVIVSAVVFLVLHKKDPEIITHEVVDPRAEPMRRLALEKCAAGDFQPCVDGLDEARRLDPAGDTKPEVQQARQAAGKALNAPFEPAPAPSAIPSAMPSSMPPSPGPSSQLSPMPSPIDSAFTKTQRKEAPTNAKPQSTEAFTAMPVPTPVPTTAPPVAPSKMQAPITKPQGKKAAPTKTDSFGSDFGSDSLGSGTGGGNKK